MKNKIQKEEVVKFRYKIFCPECKKEIIGNSPSMVNYNLKVHLREKHGKRI